MGANEKRDEGSRHASRKGLPLSRASLHNELFERVGDDEHMLAVFRRELPALAEGAIRVTDCRAKVTRSRKSIKKGRIEVVYTLGIEAGGGPRCEHVLFGIAPAGRELLDGLAEQRRVLRGHVWAAPFRELALYVEDLRLALLLFPLDPALPGLAEITGSEGARHFAPSLPECRAGTRLARIACELVHYKPSKRAVLRIQTSFEEPVRGQAGRTVYAKFFSDERGADSFENLTALWSAAAGANYLRLPEPLGFDAQRRMLVMSEAAGERCLVKWVNCLERGEPLPEGVDLARMERCARVAARALLELQRCDVRPGERREFRDELGQLRKDCALMLAEVRKKQPELGACADSVLRRLELLAPADERLVFAHTGYRHDQMVGDELDLTPIDWDAAALASPVLDAATFLARLQREPRRRPGAAPGLLQMAAAFREAFLEGRPELARALDLYEALMLSEQMLRAFRRPGDGEETAREVRLLAAEAAALLERVESTAPREASRTTGVAPGGDASAPARRPGVGDGRRPPDRVVS